MSPLTVEKTGERAWAFSQLSFTGALPLAWVTSESVAEELDSLEF